MSYNSAKLASSMSTPKICRLNKARCYLLNRDLLGLKKGRVVCTAIGERTRDKVTVRTEAASSTRQQQAEAYEAATQRLQTILTDASLSNKDVVPMDFLDACSIEEKLTLFTNLGTLTMMASILLCWVFGDYDALGGMQLDQQTLDAAVQGLGYSWPLVLCSLTARSPLFRESFPVLEELHDYQQHTLHHVIEGMDLPQISLLLFFIVFPSMMLLLPATSAALHWVGYFAHQALLQTWAEGVHIPPLHMGPLGHVLPPVVSGYLAGLGVASCFSVRPKVIELLRDAIRSADSHYRLTASQQLPSRQVGQASGRSAAAAVAEASALPTVFATTSFVEVDGDGAGEQQQQVIGCNSRMAANAFRDVAMLWLISRRRVARLSFILASLSVVYLGMIWQATGNLATPTTAAFMHAAAELLLGKYAQQGSNGKHVGQQGLGGQVADKEQNP